MGRKKKKKREARQDDNNIRTAIISGVVAGMIVEIFSRLLDWLTGR